MAGIKQLRSICPADTKEHDADVDVARGLLADRKLYARALSSVTLSAEAAPGGQVSSPAAISHRP
ncbi:MAG TPA: hypothetical protein VGB82_26440, partial [Alphaproteobacteria bacterium]